MSTPQIYDIRIDDMRDVTQEDVSLLEQRLAEKIAELQFLRKLFRDFAVYPERDLLPKAVEAQRAERADR